MKTKFAFETLYPAERDRAERKLASLVEGLSSRELARVPADLVRLEAHLERHENRNLYRASLRLSLPSGTVFADEEAAEMDVALNEAVRELERQVRRHMDKVRRDHHWRQTRRRERMEALRQPPADVQTQERRQLFFDLIEEHLDRVWTYAWRELRYLEASGSIPAGALTVEDAVDAILAEGAKRFEERPTEFSVDEWLLKLTVETLEAEARRVARSLPADALSLEEEAPEPATDPTEADQEFYEFYQPDDAPRLEDILPYPQAESPEAELEEREEALAVHRALSQLPQRWRHALALVFIEEMPRDRAAAILGTTEGALGEMIDRALAVLRAKLADERTEAETLPEARVADHLRNTRRIVVHRAMRLRLVRALGIDAPAMAEAD